MIKFFRKIRQKMIKDNKVSKYLLYAIGEIALVMIGILLALQVNTWNENKKANVKFNQLLVNVFNDLEVDLKVAPRVIAYYQVRDTIATNVINGKYSVSDYKKNQSPFPMIFQYFPFRITDMGYNALMQNTENIPSKHKELIADLNRQYIVITEAVESTLIVQRRIAENANSRYTLNFPWYSQNDAVNDEKRGQHFANDPIYKNEVRTYRSYGFGAYSGSISSFYGQGLILYLTLKTILNDTNPLPSFFPKNADSYEIDKLDYVGEYSNPNAIDRNLFIKEKNGFLIIDYDGGYSLLSLISKDKFKNHVNGRILTFKRDESNKIISWYNGLNTLSKIEIND